LLSVQHCGIVRIMFMVTKRIEFCYGHRLLKYAGKCRHLHGHNGVVEVDMRADSLDERGMVVDFTDIKSALKTWIDETLDHKLLLNKADPLIPSLMAQGEAFVPLDDNPTAEYMAKLIYEHARAKGLPVVEVRLWETPTSCAAYRG
jgi:6-pyruvoyltetrahydropterin/6-carboxytetrahydropterin synthase